MTRILRSWRGIDDPHRIDSASIELDPDRMRALGGSRTVAYATSWSLEVDPGWITRTLRVDVAGFGWWRRLELSRSAQGRWSAAVDTGGSGDPSDLPDAGATSAVLDALDGAVDCDLGLCPVTNTMPIRRLGLLEREVAETRLLMAWVDVPSLAVIPSGQLYSSAPPTADGSLRVRYESETRDFRSELTVDADGVVLEYPQLATAFPA